MNAGNPFVLRCKSSTAAAGIRLIGCRSAFVFMGSGEIQDASPPLRSGAQLVQFEAAQTSRHTPVSRVPAECLRLALLPAGNSTSTWLTPCLATAVAGVSREESALDCQASQIPTWFPRWLGSTSSARRVIDFMAPAPEIDSAPASGGSSTVPRGPLVQSSLGRRVEHTLRARCRGVLDCC